MHISTVAVYAIGFVAQAFFSARILIQWILSERARRVVSPSLYWICSIIGSILLFSYGWLRDDFSIILGQLISYYIYIWNLKAKGVWSNVASLFRFVIFFFPLTALLMMLCDLPGFVNNFFHNDAVSLPLLLFGSAGQIIFTVRFIYQWYYSFKRHESILPVGFWVISLIGSGMIVAYGIFRLDIVLILGQSVGFVAYSRNIIINKKSKI